MAVTKEKRGNHLFSEHYFYTGVYRQETKVTFTRYNTDTYHVRQIPASTASFKELTEADSINWFHITGLADSSVIYRIMKEFGLRELDVRDIVTPEHVVKIDDYCNRLLIVMNSCYFDNKQRIRSEHISIIVKGNVVLTFSEVDEKVFDNAFKGLEKNIMNIREGKSGLLLAFLINCTVSDMIETAVRVENMLDRIEDQLLDTDREYKNIRHRIQQSRRAYLILHKNTAALNNQFSMLKCVRDGIIDESMLHVFEELSDQLAYIVQTSENSKNLLSSLEELYMSNNDLRMNFIMKRLTVVSTLFIPITFLVGLWGMNFKYMPETEGRYGYIFGLAVIVGTALATWQYMKKKKWF